MPGGNSSLWRYMVPSIGGQMDPPDRQHSRAFARVLFLRVLRRVMPEILEDLHALVFPVSEQVAGSPRPDAALLLRASPSVQQHLLPLKEALLNWAEGYHLRDVWMLDISAADLRTVAGADDRRRIRGRGRADTCPRTGRLPPVGANRVAPSRRAPLGGFHLPWLRRRAF